MRRAANQVGNRATARELLEEGLGWQERRLQGSLINELLECMAASESAASESDAASGEDLGVRGLRVLRAAIDAEVRRIGEIRDLWTVYQKELAAAEDEATRKQLILRFARQLEPKASRRQRWRDARALRRQFDFAAVQERAWRREQRAEQRLAFFLERLGVVVERAMSSVSDGHSLQENSVQECWRRYEIFEAFDPFLPSVDAKSSEAQLPQDAFQGDARITVAACRGLQRAIRSLELELRGQLLPRRLADALEHIASDGIGDVWVQCEAIALLAERDSEAFCRVAIERLRSPKEGDDLFVRRRLVIHLGHRLAHLPQLSGLVTVAWTDPSPYVRQGLTEILGNVPEAIARQAWRHLARVDPAPQVRAAALLQVESLLTRPNLREEALEGLVAALDDSDDFVVRTALHVGVEVHRHLCEERDERAESFRQAARSTIDQLHSTATSIPVRRWAAAARERMLCDADPQASSLLAELRNQVRQLPVGESRQLPRQLLAGWDEERAGRVLAVLAQDDFGVDLEPGRGGLEKGGGRLTRGPVFGFRLWRLLHELRRPSPDKRQGHRHTVGRVNPATVRAPSAQVADLTPTRVPGEPLVLREEGGWRPYLPLADDFLSAVSGWRRRPTRFFTAEGVTTVKPPDGWFSKLRAQLVLTWRLPAVAALRDWRAGSPRPPADYLQVFRKLGFETTFQPYRDPHQDGAQPSADPAVSTFFPSFLPLSLGLWPEFQEYFVSAYQNSLAHLAIFLVAVTGLFLGRHLWHGRRLREARERLPLVIGGWGTRGKSGTERLKAALFNAVGMSVVSKTTGCEAMLLRSDRFGALRELFLYRPYDKATIWEQHDTTRLASKLNADVFLWECMGLTPAYVDVLQRQWMRDDLSTITNCYPDHEDIQGPTGLDVARSIGAFVPWHGRLFTSEEVMAPVLRDEARQRGTTVRSTSWLEAGLLTDDVTGRLPYDEHPSNLALVLSLADDLGIERDFALKEIGDRVVPDLGVLKTYPTALLESRQLELTNGCSANERLAALANWRRLRFDDQDPVQEPGVWIATVVNNRADRVARSQVFAEMLVRDLAADAHILIGTNLEGLRGYLRTAWRDYAEELSLWTDPEDGSSAAALENLERFARQHRLPTSQEAVTAALGAMLGGVSASDGPALLSLWQDPAALGRRLVDLGEPYAADIEAFHARQLKTFREVRALKVWLAAHQEVSAAERRRLDVELRSLLERAFERKLHVIADASVSGNAIIERTAHATPPYFRVRIMGLMNIKGTGLDHIYRWQAWERCHAACQKLRSPDLETARGAAFELATFPEFGLLCEQEVRQAMAELERHPAAGVISEAGGPDVILESLEIQLSEVRRDLRGPSSRRFEPLFELAEACLDWLDGIRRRHRADRIYRDLAAERIATERAAYELKALVERQKGGWLRSWLQTPFSRRARLKQSGHSPKVFQGQSKADTLVLSDV